MTQDSPVHRRCVCVCIYAISNLCSLCEALFLYYIPPSGYEFSDYILFVYVRIIALKKNLKKKSKKVLQTLNNE